MSKKSSSSHGWLYSPIKPGPKEPLRNQPCPCGSGRKAKRCCLASQDASKAQAIEAGRKHTAARRDGVKPSAVQG